MDNSAYKIKEGLLGKEIYVKDKKIGGYSVYFKDFPEIVAEGESLKEARKNLWDATYDILKYLMEEAKKPKK